MVGALLSGPAAQWPDGEERSDVRTLQRWRPSLARGHVSREQSAPMRTSRAFASPARSPLRADQWRGCEVNNCHLGDSYCPIVRRHAAYLVPSPGPSGPLCRKRERAL